MHGNISETNMMALRTANGQGMLVGFEFAISRSSTGTSSEPRGSSSPGTTTDPSRKVPHKAESFFARAITPHVATLPRSCCSDRPPVHSFQHELESYLWSIFFIMSGYRCGRRIVNPQLEKWYTGGWNSIKDAKKRFLDAENDDAVSARLFAESLGVDPQPLMHCSQLLAGMLDSRQPNAVRMLSILQETRDSYLP
jgi:hypothetical protein